MHNTHIYINSVNDIIYTSSNKESLFFIGSNIILLRLMVKIGLKNPVKFLTMDSEIELCQSSYVSSIIAYF